MELLLIRHAQPVVVDFDPDGADPELTEVGVRQAKAMAEYLGDERVDAVWSSPQRRARETAQPLADLHGLAVNIDERIAEFDYGHTSYAGQPKDPMAQTPEQVAELLDELRNPAFQQRILECVDDIVEAHSGQTVALVCHGGVIGALLTRMLGIPDLLTKVGPSYTSVTRVAASRSGFRTMRSFNECQWLQSI